MNKEQRHRKWPWMRFTSTFMDIFAKGLVLTAPVWGVTCTGIVGLGLVFSAVERIRVFQGLYFALITAMTIGYGDIVPATPSGRILAVLIGFLGILTTGLFVAVAIQAVTITYKKIAGKNGSAA